jgi:hypothetical protein
MDNLIWPRIEAGDSSFESGDELPVSIKCEEVIN